MTALIELMCANHKKLKDEGRGFDCSQCSDRVMDLRRCKEDREDFTSDDGPMWPLYIEKGGGLYGFCPGKVTRDKEIFEMYNILVISTETGQLPYKGCLNEQPGWFVRLLSWFIPLYRDMVFKSRMKAILGDGDALKALKGVKSGGNRKR